ncbi:hypothetical protein ACT7DJ_10375 [Bacillus cereus]
MSFQKMARKAKTETTSKTNAGFNSDSNVVSSSDFDEEANLDCGNSGGDDELGINGRGRQTRIDGGI